MCRAVRVAASNGVAAERPAAEAAPPGHPSMPRRAGAAQADEEWEYEYTPHPDFPELPRAAPLTFTLTMHACLSHNPSERPTFRQVRSAADTMPLRPAAGLWLPAGAACRGGIERGVGRCRRIRPRGPDVVMQTKRSSGERWMVAPHTWTGGVSRECREREVSL